MVPVAALRPTAAIEVVVYITDLSLVSFPRKKEPQRILKELSSEGENLLYEANGCKWHGTWNSMGTLVHHQISPPGTKMLILSQVAGILTTHS